MYKFWEKMSNINPIVDQLDQINKELMGKIFCLFYHTLKYPNFF